jgi:serine/threonine protein kinase
MTPERWRQIEDVYEAVMARPASERADAVDVLCAGDERLRQEVESLVAHAGDAAAFLETPAFAVADVAGEPDIIGRQFGVYLVQSALGTGGMGEVYRARDQQLGRDVAVKILPRLSSSDPARLARFEQEARMLAALNHPHIGAIYGLEQMNGSPALVLEFVEGETLADRLARAGQIASGVPSPLTSRLPGVPLQEALTVARQIAAALEAAHERGIVHRDLKPANIMISPDGLVKVLDFGLAKFAGHEGSVPELDLTRAPTAATATRDGVIVGTAAYMSPEQAAGKAVDKRGDLWAFGVVLLEMLTGRPVFGGETVTEVLAAALTTEPDWTTLPAETPGPIRTLLRRCLEKDRTRRLDSATAARLEIDDALTTSSREDVATALVHTWRWSKPSRLAVGLAVAIVLLVAGGLWRLWQQDFFWRNPLDGATVERLTDFEGDEFDAAISPDGRVTAFLSDRDGPLDAWVSQIGSSQFVNLTKGQFQLTANRVTRQAGFSGDGTRVWFLQQVAKRPVGWTSWLAPAIGGTPRAFVENGLNPVWSPDGRSLVYHSADPGDPIFIADPNGNSSRQVFRAQPGVHNHYPTWSPDGRFVYFVSGTLSTEDMDIWRISLSTGDTAATPERITSHHSSVAYPAWLDARTLIYAATAEDGSGQWLYAMDVEHRIPHRVSSGIAEQYLSVAVSGTRPRRVVAAVATPTASLWTVPIADGVQNEEAVTRVRTANSRASGPRFAPAYLAFLSSKGGANGLWKLEEGIAQELWRGDDGGIVAPPAISPDGRLICFSSRRRGTTGLYVMNANGTNVRTLVDSFDVRGPASWSPDGNWLAVAANLGQGTRVFKLPLAGGQPVQLVDTLSDRPLWSPAGQFILYSELLAAGGDEVKAITPGGAPVVIPDVRIDFAISTTYRFMADGKSLIALEGPGRGAQNFFQVDLRTGQRRQLTNLKGGFAIQNFDVSLDGKHIVFDRVRDNSDIVLMNLAR